ncbi:hypothetical protein CWI85_20800 [Streptomyces albidoflavus]|nr:hypothetical protein CWI85_20800 [Streptomyces albidoflavus]
MARMMRLLAAGVTLSLACAACAAPEAEPVRSSSAADPGELARLPEVDVAGDPFSGMDVTTPQPARRIIGEVIADGERIILYTQGRKCGLVALPEKEAEAGQVSLQLLSAWPKAEGEGSGVLPGGPYMRTSGYGSGEDRAWAELSCGKDVAAVRYLPAGAAEGVRHEGAVSVRVSGTDGRLSIAAGSAANRSKVLSALAS